MPRTLEKTKEQNALVVQDNVERAINPLLRNPIIDGVLVRGIALLAANETAVSHMLGRDLIGFVITRRNANAVVYEATTANTQRDKVVLLKTSADCTADIYFF